MQINAQTRTQYGKKTRTLRAQSFIPAIVYGSGKPAVSVTISAYEFVKAYRAAGASTIVDLSTNEGIKKVLIKQVDRHPVSDAVLHVDFQEIDMAKKIRTQIPLVLTGESPAVKMLGGVLVHALDRLDIECLPQDLAHSYEVPLQGLANIGDVIRVRDVSFPSTIHIFTKPDAAIVIVEAQRAEEEIPAAETSVDVSAVKTEQEEKRAAAQAKAEEEKSIEGK